MSHLSNYRRNALLGMVFLFALIIYPLYSVSNTHAKTNNVEEVVLRIDGMSCASCPATVKLAITGVDGVVDASVSYKEKKAVVHYVKNKVEVKKIIEAIEDAGYGAKVLP